MAYIDCYPASPDFRTQPEGFSLVSHIPVMCQDVVDSLQPEAGAVYVDGTFGGGGYAKAFLDAAACTVIAIDRDPEAERRAHAMQAEYGARLVFIRGTFGNVRVLLEEQGIGAVDGFVLDVGVSSYQIDQAGRGFSFQDDGPLDMRMDNTQGQTAADIVNDMAERDLANIIYRYGEERHSRRVAKAIIARRREQPFQATADLADTVRGAVPRSGADKIDPATRTFQALRIAVNDELGELEGALEAAPHILKPGGKVIVVSFHSLEDRIVKEKFRTYAGQDSRASRHMPETGTEKKPLFTLPSRKAIRPSEEECARNPRARSARMRVAVRTQEAAS